MWSTKFWAETVERAVKTFAQTLAALLIGDAAISHVYATIGAKVGMAGLAAVVSLLTSVGGVAVGANNSPAWLPEEADPPAPRKKRKRSDKGHADIPGLLYLALVALVIVVILAIVGVV